MEASGRPSLELSWSESGVKLSFDRLETLLFDQEGRPISWTRPLHSYRRGYDGGIKEITRFGDDATHYYDARLLEPGEAVLWQKELQERLHSAWQRLRHPALRPALQFCFPSDEANFTRVYKPVGILPPNQYRALVLQLTQGCSYNRCTFCNFYKNQTYAVKTMSQFRTHVAAAVAFMGRALGRRRGVFLGEANAGSLPTEVLADALQEIRAAFPPTLRDRQGRGCHPLQFHKVGVFLDTFTRVRPVEEWKRLRELGLNSIYLGMESGSVSVLRLLGKPGHPRRVEQTVERLKQAGLKVHPIVMTGAGGQALAGEHLSQTVDSLKRMPLGPGDQVYLSEFAVHPGEAYEKRAADLQTRPLDRLECRQQTRALREALGYPVGPAAPSTSLYDVRQFVYA